MLLLNEHLGYTKQFCTPEPMFCNYLTRLHRFLLYGANLMLPRLRDNTKHAVVAKNASILLTLSVPPYTMRKNPHVDEFCCLYDDKVLFLTWSTNEISTWQHDINKCRSTSSKQHHFDELALRKVGYTHKRKTHFSTDHCKSSLFSFHFVE